jgi:hypothetical protein
MFAGEGEGLTPLESGIRFQVELAVNVACSRDGYEPCEFCFGRRRPKTEEEAVNTVDSGHKAVSVHRSGCAD